MESIGKTGVVGALLVPISNKANDQCGVQLTMSLVSGDGDVDNYELLVDVTFRQIPRSEVKTVDLDTSEFGLNVPMDTRFLGITLHNEGITIEGYRNRKEM